MLPEVVTAFDDGIDALIAEMQPAIEFTIEPEFLSNTSNTELQAALKLGVLELISGEFLSQRTREAGYAEDFQIGGIRIGQFWERGKALLEQGTARLAVFLKTIEASEKSPEMLSTTKHTNRQVTAESMAEW